MTIYEALKDLDPGYYPFHMPGHKRRRAVAGVDTAIDITEITGFDDLRNPTGILKDELRKAADVFGAKESFYLVNGSTVGNLSAIYAMCSPGEEAAVFGTCHPSVYNACRLRGLRVIGFDVQSCRFGPEGSVTIRDIEEAFDKYPQIKLVVITSPTYEGVLSDIDAIGDMVHAHGARLYVDGAHGAHLIGAFRGADAFVNSLHKTLPSFTQTALLHLNDENLSEKTKKALNIFQTSSPSYILMAGISECVKYMEEEFPLDQKDLEEMLKDFYGACGDLENIYPLSAEDFKEEGIFGHDGSRLVIYSEKISGEDMHHILHRDYKIEMEMYRDKYVVGIATVCDEPDGFGRLAKALGDMDGRI